jgi:hypothetical protein
VQGYLQAKAQRMEHMLDGSFCFWDHDGEPSGPTSSIDGGCRRRAARGGGEGADAREPGLGAGADLNAAG